MREGGPGRAAGITLVEVVVGMALAVLIGGLVHLALTSLAKPIDRGTRRSGRLADIRLAVEKMTRELRTGRQVLFPAPRLDGTPSPAERLLVFRDFRGRFVMYVFDASSGEIRRTPLPLEGIPVDDADPLARGVEEALFSVSLRGLVSLLLIVDDVPVLHSVRMVNS